MNQPLIVHVVHRFDFGGLENGVINLVNGLEAFRHAIVALTDATEVAQRVKGDNVSVFALGKRPGRDFMAYVRLFRLIRRLQPDVVHTRNVGTLDCQIVAWLAGVRGRVHSEHGWDVGDPQGHKKKYQVLRKVLLPLVQRVVPLSVELETWLREIVGVRPGKMVRICNGVDLDRFAVSDRKRDRLETVGSVARLSPIKDPLSTIDAFVKLSARHPGIRLLFVGDGPLTPTVERTLKDSGLAGCACLPGAALDVAPCLGQMDVFVLSSLREGISNTILEAMAAGLPVVATRTGGNPELVVDGVTGFLVDPGSSDALAAAISRYLEQPGLLAVHGAAARARVEQHFSLAGMVRRYAELYDSVCHRNGGG